MRAHYVVLVGGGGRDLGVRDPPVLHPQGLGAVGGHLDSGDCREERQDDYQVPHDVVTITVCLD